MTDQEQRAKFEQAQQEFMRRAQQEQAETHQKLQRAIQQAQQVQQEINHRPHRVYAAIVAVDLRGGFSKDSQIPWYYAADFKWFQSKTKGHVCVMGRTTYDDINERLGDKAAESVLPARTCFVVTSRPLPRNNATAIAGLHDLDFALDKQDVSYDKTVYFCGGERIYQEGLSKCSTIYMTVVNKEVGCDKFFPKHAMKDWVASKVETVEGESDLKFVTWTHPK